MAKNPFTQRMDVSGSQLVDRVKEIAQDANARKVIVRDQQGKELLTVPLGWGAAGGAMTILAAPWLALLAAVGAAAAKVRIEVEGTGTPDIQDGQMRTGGGADGEMPIIRTDTPGWDAPPSDQV